MADSKKKDRLAEAITLTREILARLEDGLLSGEPLDEMEKLAKEASMSALAIEVMVSGRRGKSIGSLLASVEPKPTWLV